LALTAPAIEKLKPGPSRREVPDRDGLFLVVQPSGAKSWAYRYRSPADGKPRKLTIGSYPAYGLGDAREKAFEAMKSAQRGVDPVDEAKAIRARARDRSHLVKDLIDDYLVKYEGEHKTSSTAEVRRLLDKWVRPAIGEKRVQDVVRRDVLAILEAMVKAGAPISANRLLAILKPFFAWVRVHGDPLPTLPTASVDKPTSEDGRDRDRVLTDEEIRWLWMATEPAGPFNAVVRLLLLTGQRRSEVGGLTDGELHLGVATNWSIPAGRTKNGRAHTVPLSPLAREVLSTVPRIDGSGLLFTTDGRVPISGWSKGKAALDRRMLEVAQAEARERGNDPANIQLTGWRLHDLRRTAASGMARLGHPIHVVEAVLNHKSGVLSGVAAIYNRHDYLAEKQRALESWAGAVADIVHGEVRSNVVKLMGQGFGQGR